MRWIDVIGLSGAAMWVTGVFLFLSTSAERMDWEHCLGGFILSVAGFACIVIWLLLRWSQSQCRGDW
jgi:hypothetical protein